MSQGPSQLTLVRVSFTDPQSAQSKCTRTSHPAPGQQRVPSESAESRNLAKGITKNYTVQLLKYLFTYTVVGGKCCMPLMHTKMQYLNNKKASPSTLTAYYSVE